MPMRVECKNYESRTYASGETVRKCNLDLAPEAPWRCPDNCPKYERRLADAGWVYGTLTQPATPAEPPGVGHDDSVAALLDEAEGIVNAAAPDALSDLRRRRRPRGGGARGWRRLFRRR